MNQTCFTYWFYLELVLNRTLNILDFVHEKKKKYKKKSDTK